MAVPSVLPTEPIALEVSRKRRHSQAASISGEHDATATATATAYAEPTEDRNSTPSPEAYERNIEDSDDNDEEDDKSACEDLLDKYEDEPYVHDDSMNISSAQITEWRQYLRKHGPDEFFEEMHGRQGIDLRKLGMAFNLSPHVDVEEDMYQRLLGLAVVRFYFKRSKLLDYNNVDDAADLLRTSRKIIVITGAGISTSLGIPDFRSKNSGFYERLRDLGFEDPEEVFHIETFDVSPDLFYNMAHMVLPDDALGVSPTHAFIRLLQDNGRLQRNYTQNIDDLEGLAGIDRDKIVQCHGSFATATCRKCKHKVEGKEIFDDIRAKTVSKCKACFRQLHQPKVQPRPQKRSRYQSADEDDDDVDDDIPQPGIMKPDITFFGEQLPGTFFDRFTKEDAKEADLVIVIGTSLKVAPVSEMPNFLPHETPHIYISLDPIKHVEFDIQLLGKCDDVVVELCRRAGWDLKHDKISPDALEVKQSEGHDHHWLIGPKEKVIPESVNGESQETLHLES